jgi:hypothetical protein
MPHDSDPRANKDHPEQDRMNSRDARPEDHRDFQGPREGMQPSQGERFERRESPMRSDRGQRPGDERTDFRRPGDEGFFRSGEVEKREPRGAAKRDANQGDSVKDRNIDKERESAKDRDAERNRDADNTRKGSTVSPNDVVPPKSKTTAIEPVSEARDAAAAAIVNRPEPVPLPEAAG